MKGKQVDLGTEQTGCSKNAHLLAIGSEVLSPLISAFEEIKSDISQLTKATNPNVSKRAAALTRKLDSFTPSITLIGQVKAGKTALTNALIGSPGLLPSDVNPWTSVVTTLYINSKTADKDRKAIFTFFDKDEWSNLVKNGGRLGELAERAGAADELEKIQQQIEEMREQTKARLGANFELLLGESHNYSYYDHALINRYVCIGEPEDQEGNQLGKQGRFADITRSAELQIDLPQLPGSLILRDTPGVNDTFMVREQVTLKSLRGSEICLVVLSAHQALNTTDMALVRMISSFENRQVILFVNRIDELASPGEQIPEIRKSIVATLKASAVKGDIEVIFGSAKWAEAALNDDLQTLVDESQEALVECAQAVGHTEADDSITHAWILSGIPALMESINRRILEGSGKRMLETVRTMVTNLVNELMMEKSARNNSGEDTEIERLELPALKTELADLISKKQKKMHEVVKVLRVNLNTRLEKTQVNFIRRATNTLITHLERFGEQDTWQYEPTGLRLLLRSSYLQFSAAAKRQATGVYAEAASEIEALYFKAIGAKVDDFSIEPPLAPIVPPPVVLGKTIVLDLNSSWWRRWWQKRKGFEAFASDYAALIQIEVASVVQELESTQVEEVFVEIQDTLNEFLNDQSEALLHLAENLGGEITDVTSLSDQKEIEAVLGDALATLDRVAA